MPDALILGANMEHEVLKTRGISDRTVGNREPTLKRSICRPMCPEIQPKSNSLKSIWTKRAYTDCWRGRNFLRPYLEGLMDIVLMDVSFVIILAHL